MNTRNIRPRFRLNGMTLALAVALSGMMTAQMVCAETKADTTTSSAQKATKSQKEDTILVTASPGNESATSTLKAPVSTGALGTASALDTPFSVSTVTEKEIQDKQITTARELFANDPSVTIQGNAFSSYGAQLSVRGISSVWDGFINGLPITTINQETFPEMFERVDVLKGATGFMYGFGAPGGAVNYVTKRPTDEGLFVLTTGYRSKGAFSQAIDAGGRTGPDDRFGFRLNMVNEQGSLPVRDARISRQSVGLDLDARITPRTILYGNLMYGKRFIKNPSANSFNVAEIIKKNGEELPRTISLSNLRSRVGDGEIDDRTLFSQLGLEWTVAEGWGIKTDYMFQKNNERFVSPLPYLSDSNGNYIMKVYDTKVFNINNTLQSVINGKFNSGFIDHELNAGFTSRIYKTARSPDGGMVEAGDGNIFEPTVFDYHKKNMRNPSAYDRTTEQGVFVSDRLSFNENWEFLAGVRHTDYKQTNGARTKNYRKAANTPTFALIFKPEVNTSIYTSYVEALEQGGTVGPRYKNANEMLPPLKSKQYEVGVKTDQNRWSATAALFRIERGAEYANADNVWVQDGEQLYQGLELGGKVIISKNYDFSASTMWLDPTYRNVDPTKKSIEGKTVAGVPRFQSVVELGWTPDIIPDLRTSLRWRHDGSASTDEKNNIRVPSHDLLDLYVNYDTEALGRSVTARFGVNNLTDKKYWTAGAYSTIYAGEPRTFMANVSVRF
ncbi:TonB-dependent siderophore receptor [Salmonella enterica]|nr:TonB-dependent siderophore receptor [Salmonella enterica]